MMLLIEHVARYNSTAGSLDQLTGLPVAGVHGPAVGAYGVASQLGPQSAEGAPSLRSLLFASAGRAQYCDPSYTSNKA